MNYIDRMINRFTMYRLLVLVLGGLTVLGIFFAFMGRFSSSPSSLVVSFAALLAGAYAADRGFGRLFAVTSNMESSLITALILFLIVQPAHTIGEVGILVLAGAVSSASKFLITYHGKHIFNPAAFAAAVLSLTGLHAVTWWIGSSALWPFALILGLVLVRKIRRFPLVLTFLLAAAVLQYVLFVYGHQPVLTDMKHALLASPLIFLGTIMLTEPATMPPRRNLQIVFAIVVAVFYVTAFRVGPLRVYPEVALLLGNLYAFAVSPKLRVRLQLVQIQKISDRVYNYIFAPDQRFAYIPGQYMEWTLPGVRYDSRGNRRSFTIASSPTEPTVQLGLKYFEPASTYKKALFEMQPGDTIYASQLAGDFTIRGSETKQLAFIAGGIGITPFRSIIKNATDLNRMCDIVLLYVVSNADELAYGEELLAARAVGIRTCPIVTNLSYQADGIVTAKLTQELITKLIPDYATRIFYVSGSNGMVDATHSYLQNLGVPRRHIKTDHFSGY